MKIVLRELMASSGVKFGTSGARGLAVAMTDRVCHAYTLGFLDYLRASGQLDPADAKVAVGGDLRPSTARIAAAVCEAIRQFGGTPVWCGRVPSPAVALYGFQRRIPSIMVTGSHIPDDRNGIKFNKPTGEVLKSDEEQMTGREVSLPPDLFDAEGNYRNGSPALPGVDANPAKEYVRRYLDVFPNASLSGTRIGVYEHSAVGRELIGEILVGLGASVVPLGRSEKFVPVDTEAIRPEDVTLARRWAAETTFDAIVSTDGDSDRPLISDERGEWVRGDVAGILCARFLRADSVSTPVSSNTALEKSGWFTEIRRTRIGSPYVVASMLEASASGRHCVVGYEANGGFLLNSTLDVDGRALAALPTRDAVLPILGVLLLARQEGRTVSQFVASLPPRHTASDRLQDFPVERSQAILAHFTRGNDVTRLAAFSAAFGTLAGGRAVALDLTDGARATFENGEIVHLRPSGNAPELRCYTEADTAERAAELCAGVLKKLQAGDPDIALS